MKGNSKGFTYFAWLHPSAAGHGFVASYIDEDGQHVYISNGEDDTGRKLFRRFKFTPSKRIISVPNSQQDVIDFLRNYPDCEGSPNGAYAQDNDGKKVQIGAVYKEINEGKDAKVGVEATKLRIQATSHALELEDPKRAAELREIAVLSGYYGQDQGLQHWHILQYAENSPERYLEIVNDSARKAKYIIKEGLSGENPVLKKKGFMIYWENVRLGNNIDEAVQKILSDKTLFEGIESALNRTHKTTK